MYSSTVNTNSEMSIISSISIPDHSNPNLASSNVNQSPFITSNETSSNNHNSYPNLASPSASSLNYMDLLHTWNYHQFLASTLRPVPLSDNSSSDYHPRNGSFHYYYPRLVQKPTCQQTDDEIFLSKFHHDTLVNLDAGESKNIQQLTTNDFLTSAKRSHQYSSLLARVEYISLVDKSTGKAELRFRIDDIEKTTSYFVLQEMPFFVHQHSCWSSISPEHTYRLCGLKCRQLECGDIIIAITEQPKKLSTKLNDKPDYKQQSPTKCLVGRYINGEISSSKKRHKISNE